MVYGTLPLVVLAEKWPALVTGYTVNVLVVLFQTGIAEELGWRGMALPLLSTCYQPIVRALILGAAAGFWHLPNALLQPGGLATFGLILLYTILVAFLLNWAYHSNRGSVLIVALFHAALNTSTGVIMQVLPSVDRQQFVQHIYLVAIVVVAAAAALILGLTRGQLAAQRAGDH